MTKNSLSKIVGRENEISILNEINQSNKPHLVAIYGRRRVGKTFLIRNVFNKNINYVEFTGIKAGSLNMQLESFAKTYAERFLDGADIKISSWRQAFEMLLLRSSSGITIFIDELPWLCTPKSGLLEALEYFWNTKFSQIENIKIILCGSATQWMLKKIVHAKGGLHNRLTRIISLEPFNLSESKKFLESKNIYLENNQILDLYLTTGGIPYYLEWIRTGQSAAQAIQELCFSNSGVLYKEYDSLLSSLFDQSLNHLTVIEQLAKHRYGLSRSKLLKVSKLSEGGTASSVLSELEASGFIRKYIPFSASSRNAYYRLTDEYVLFYLHWISPLKKSGLTIDETYWLKQFQTIDYKIWCGYSFEITCLKHIAQIKKSLGISGVLTKASTWRTGISKPNAQIDLVLDRADRIVNLCEIKYSPGSLIISRNLKEDVSRRQSIFKIETKTKKSVTSILISSGSLTSKFQADNIIMGYVSGDELFD